MRRARSAAALEEPEINITALIDVVFVILIMFILVAPLLDIDKILLAESGESKESLPVADAGTVTIEVNAKNEILFNKIAAKSENLDHLLKQAHERSPKAVVRLFQDRAASFGTYQTIKNAAQKAGFEELDIVLKPG